MVCNIMDLRVRDFHSSDLDYADMVVDKALRASEACVIRELRARGIISAREACMARHSLAEAASATFYANRGAGFVGRIFPRY